MRSSPVCLALYLCVATLACVEASAEVKTGACRGNGTGQSVAGLGLSPDYVVVAGATARRALPRPLAAADSYRFWAGSAHADAVTSLDADGFTVATSNFANEAGVAYHYAAGNAVEGDTVAGAYVGSGTDGRSSPRSPSGWSRRRGRERLPPSRRAPRRSEGLHGDGRPARGDHPLPPLGRPGPRAPAAPLSGHGGSGRREPNQVSARYS